jgi:chromosome segregation ATPase
VTTALEVDRRLAAWNEWLKRIDDSLLALEGEPTYQMLAGTAGKRAPLDGISQARVSPALDALADLFEHRQRLGEVLDRATELRASMSTLGFFQNDDKLRQIQELLDGPSIHLGAMQKPLAQRSLLDRGAEELVATPEQLLAAMQRAFEVARDAVLAVQSAWATLEPAMERMEAEVAALRDLAERVGVLETVRGELSDLAAALDVDRARVARDPLGVTGTVEGALAPRIAEVRRRVSHVAAERDAVTTGLARAAAARRELGEAHVKARAARAAALGQFAAAKLPELVVDDMLDGLDAWREKLEQTAAARRWSSAKVGLERWEQACAQYLASDRAVLTAAFALVQKHDELRGRLSARVAQLQALVQRGAPRDPQLDRLAHAAEAALAKVPLALDVADVSVSSFERGVVELARRAGR